MHVGVRLGGGSISGPPKVGESWKASQRTGADSCQHPTNTDPKTPTFGPLANGKLQNGPHAPGRLAGGSFDFPCADAHPSVTLIRRGATRAQPTTTLQARGWGREETEPERHARRLYVSRPPRKLQLLVTRFRLLQRQRVRHPHRAEPEPPTV